MSLIGDAIQEVCNPRRINYSIYGNTDVFLHAHIFPRYEWEPEDRIPKPVWQYSEDKWHDSKYHFSAEEHGELKEKLSKQITDLINQAY